MSSALLHDRLGLIAGQHSVDGSLASIRNEHTRRLSQKGPKELAQEFGAILLAEAVKAMRRTVSRSSLLPASAYHGVYDGLFDLELARSVVKQSGLGVGVDAALARSAPGGDSSGHGTPAAIAPAAPREKRTGSLAIRGGGGSGRSMPAKIQADRGEGRRAGAAPVSGTVTSGFGYRKDPIDGTHRFHAGLDIAAPAGSPIRAVDEGEVVFSGWRAGTGYTVVVAHGEELTSTYAHARSLAVRGGQKVAAGEVIATVGESGRTTGPHLHLELRYNGQPIDPAKVLPVA